MKSDWLKVHTKAVVVNGTTYYVRPLTGAQLELMQDADDGAVEGIRALSRVVFFCACDQEGSRVFDEMDEVRNLGMDLIKPVAEAALELSGLGEDAEGEA